MKVAGIDIWKGKWVIVTLDEGSFCGAFTAGTIPEALDRLADAHTIGIDIPIGLPVDGNPREADALVRKAVGPRRNSVFPTPQRELLTAETAAAANLIARERGWPGITKQSFALRRAILEVDAIADADERIYEIHPELTFSVMAECHLATSKKAWNGLHQRIRLLADNGIVLPHHIDDAGVAAADDVVDAAACAWSARRVARGIAEALRAGIGRSPAIWA